MIKINSFILREYIHLNVFSMKGFGNLKNSFNFFFRLVNFFFFEISFLICMMIRIYNGSKIFNLLYETWYKIKTKINNMMILVGVGRFYVFCEVRCKHIDLLYQSPIYRQIEFCSYFNWIKSNSIAKKLFLSEVFPINLSKSKQVKFFQNCKICFLHANLLLL